MKNAKRKADGPALPRPDARGTFPAVQHIRASIAREVIRRRRAAGLSQTALAELAGVRQETISNIETARHTVSAPVMAKIERALERIEDKPAVRCRRSA